MNEADGTDIAQRMDKSIHALEAELARLRTGRASTALLENIKVTYYGTRTALNQLAGISISDSHTLLVTVWDKAAVPDIEKAILDAGLGLNPVSGGEVIRVPLPALTEERRKEITKLVRTEGERARVSIRNIRRDEINGAREALKNKEMSEDEVHKLETNIQKLTNDYIGKIDRLIGTKEAEVMEV